jgi:tyrosine-protein phosphatase YwqE
MSIYKNLEAIIDIAKDSALKYGMNYNVILFNPDLNGNFDPEISTYEYVMDSYFEKERPNVILLYKTDDLLYESNTNEVSTDDVSVISTLINDNMLPNLTYSKTNHEIGNNTTYGYPFVRENSKTQNNGKCLCGSDKKFKKCCKNKI